MQRVGWDKHVASEALMSSLTYNTYLKVDELLALQEPASHEHDETLFIVVHQVYELWFKQVLHEVDHLCELLLCGDVHRAQHTFKRVLTILKVLVGQLDVLETMTPLEFLSFRERLAQASGFQSDQFRQLEFVLGKKSAAAVERFVEGSRARAALQQRFDAPTLWDAFLTYLAREGHAVPDAELKRNVTQSVAASPDLQEVLIGVYRNDAKNAELCERLVDLDEGMQEWRYRHVKMVERTLGAKMGTGGSSGAGYLRTTLEPLFKDLWDIRARL